MAHPTPNGVILLDRRVKKDRQQSSIIPLYDVHQKGLFLFIPCKEAENIYGYSSPTGFFCIPFLT